MDSSSVIEQAGIQTLLDHLDEVAIWVVDQNGSFGYISDGFEQIWGISADDIRTDPERLIETIHPADREMVQAQMQQQAEEVTEEQYECRIVRPDGEVRWTKVQIVPLHGSDDSLDTIIGISTDITEQKRRERELEVLNRLLRHDIRNDMTVIQGWSDVLEAYVDEDGMEYLQKIQTSGQHVVDLTDVAREYLATVTSGTEMDVGAVDLPSTLLRVVETRQTVHPEATIVVDGEIPQVEVWANELVESVFRNLLTNAVVHNDSDDPRIEISVTQEAGTVEVRIADNGPGIPDEQKETIFQDGFLHEESGGSGLGLYLVQTLIQQYDGDVWVTDNEPRGSVFTVRLRTVE